MVVETSIFSKMVTDNFWDTNFFFLTNLKGYVNLWLFLKQKIKNKKEFMCLKTVCMAISKHKKEYVYLENEFV